MRKIITSIICATIMFALPSQVQARDLGDILAGFLTRKSQAECTLSSDISKVMDDLKAKTTPIDNAVQDSFLTMVSILSDENGASTWSNEIRSIINNTRITEQEKSNLLTQKMSDYLNTIKKDRRTFISTMKNLPQDKKTELKNQIAIMEKNSKEYLNLGKQSAKISSKLLKNASRSDDLSSVVTDINEAAKDLKNKAKSSLTLTGQVKLLSKLAGI